MTRKVSALTEGRPHSEQNPYHMAIYLHSLIKAAMHLVEDYPGPNDAEIGISGLMTVIEERAGALSMVLDASAFCEHWPKLDAWLSREPSLGLGAKREAAQ